MSENRPPCPSGRYWRVAPGDTLYRIASRVSTTVDELLRLNPGINPYNLRIGQVLCLPPEEPPCASGVYWRVAPGDTLWIIARETGTTVERLLELNPNLDPLNLQPGMSICLPG
ncbi:MAG: LysM peptidoglycan-binding domain-containing protein [Firmicutes bacterium]|nr:LysM peptidoglycan-binding domain-containing protein [Bacillota bacterium]